MSAVAWWIIHVLNRSKCPVSTSVLKIMRPQNVIQSMTQKPVSPPYKYDLSVPTTGACHTITPSGTVMTPTMMEASQAVMRRTASMKSNAMSGTREVSTLSHRCPAGSRTCSNIAVFLSHGTRLFSNEPDRAHKYIRGSNPAVRFQHNEVRTKSGQSNITNKRGVKRKFQAGIKVAGNGPT